MKFLSRPWPPLLVGKPVGIQQTLVKKNLKLCSVIVIINLGEILEDEEDMVLLVCHDHLRLSILIWSHELTVVTSSRFIPTLIVMPSHKETTEQ